MLKSTQYALEVGHKGARRLELLNQVCNPFSLAFIDSIGEFKGKHVLDLGCGTGLMTLELAKLVGATGFVTAVDISKEQLDVASKKASDQGIENIAFIESPAENIKSIDQKYSLIYCRFLLAHLSAYLDVIQQAISLLDDGGVLLCEEPSDVDAMFSRPESPIFSQWKMACKDQLRIHRSNFSVGRELFEIFQKNGLINLRVNPIQPLLEDPESKQQLWLGLEEIKPSLIKDGKYTGRQIDDLISDLQVYAALPGYIVGLYQYFQVMGQRPPQINLTPTTGTATAVFYSLEEHPAEDRVDLEGRVWSRE